MTTPSFYNPEIFQKALEEHYAQMSKEDSLKKIRDVSWDQFLEIGLPSKNEEAYRYIKLRQLYNQAFVSTQIPGLSPEMVQNQVLPECLQSCLVFVNGCYQEHLSLAAALPEQMMVIPLSEATKTYGSFLNHHWPKTIKEEVDPFAILNSALHTDGLFVYLAPKTLVEAPVQILHLVDPGMESMLMTPRIHLFAGASSQAEFIVTYAELSGQRYLFNQAIDVVVEDNAHFRLTHLNKGISADAWYFDALRATTKKNSTLQVVNFNEGSANVRNDYRVTMKGENGQADLNGVWLLQGKRETHTYVVIDHQAPYCRSRQLFKGVLNDLGCSSFEGKILVRQAADKTDAFQLNNNILLSDLANADSKPNLEIFSPDVKASHGATVGQLDAEQLFYLKTRGFSDQQAKSLLIDGFCRDVVDLIPIISAKESIINRINDFLNERLPNA